MILLVEDHEDSRDLLMHLFRQEGYGVHPVDTAAAALDYLSTHTPRLVITDYSMPGMSGLDLLKAIRAQPQFAQLPVLMFSAYGEGVKAAAFNAGANGFVPKETMDWALLYSEVLSLIGRGPHKSSAPAVPDVPQANGKHAG